jgi:DNA invertase Pin-like site-specific DNA recombinase
MTPTQALKRIEALTPADSPVASILAQERAARHERQRQGIAIARAAGRYKGRQSRLTPERLQEARLMQLEGFRVSVIAFTLGVARSTLWRALRR